jgi:hypothetical protein
LEYDVPGVDTESRKKRRNRTTQSCLNCHTSKRKCDRKRPACLRCIQLGLTGLCVYEVDDPTARDDPNFDEITHCRSRIAELEALVRELRGKPHPQWAGRARNVDDSRRSLRGTRGTDSRSRSGSDSDRDGLSGVKAEPGSSSTDASLYTLTSPFEPAGMRQQAMGYYDRDDTGFPPTSPGVTAYSGSPYTEVSAPSYFSRQTPSHASTPSSYPVSAHTSPSLSIHMPMQHGNGLDGSVNMLSSLAQQLQATVTVLRQLPEHATTETSMQLLNRATDLQAALSAWDPRVSTSSVPTYASPVQASTPVVPPAMTNVAHHGHDGDYRLGHDQWQTVPSNPYPQYDAVPHHDSGVYMKTAGSYHVGSVGA